MVAYNGAAVFYFFYIVLSTTLIKNKYSEKETPGHFERRYANELSTSESKNEKTLEPLSIRQMSEEKRNVKTD
jgi:hypothetical protein